MNQDFLNFLEQVFSATIEKKIDWNVIRSDFDTVSVNGLSFTLEITDSYDYDYGEQYYFVLYNDQNVGDIRNRFYESSDNYNLISRLFEAAKFSKWTPPSLYNINI